MSPTSRSLVPASQLAAVLVTDPGSGRSVALFFHALLSFPSSRGLEITMVEVIVGLFYLEVTVVQSAWFLFADVPGFLVVRPAPGTCS
jgi:hypothetical protein